MQKEKDSLVTDAQARSLDGNYFMYLFVSDDSAHTVNFYIADDSNTNLLPFGSSVILTYDIVS